MLKKLRRRLADVRAQKFKHFADFEPIIKKICNEYGHLFPKFQETRNGSSYVYHFGIQGVYPISLEKEHGSRDFIPPKFAKFAIQGIEDVLDFIEANVPDEHEADSKKENDNERPVAGEEAAGTLPEPEIPDGDSGG
jgi:hypothetical protein